jgi:bacterioferritin
MNESYEAVRIGPSRKGHAATTPTGQDGAPIMSLIPALPGVGIRIARFGDRVLIDDPVEAIMADNPSATKGSTEVTREQLVGLLNEDLAREYQAIIAYVIYSQVLKGAQYMSIAKELEIHASEELAHALIVSKQIDYLGGTPTATPKPVKVSDKAEELLRFDLDNENETVRHYRERVRQCEALGEFALAEQIREILVQEQEHQIDLATALGIDVPDVSRR